MDTLSGILARAQSWRAMGEEIAEASQREVGFSSFSFVRTSGPVLSPGDIFAANSKVSEPRAAETIIQMLPMLNRELRPFELLFRPHHRVFNLEDHCTPHFMRHSASYNECFRGLGVERQLVGSLGPPRAPAGYLCFARTEHEKAFSEGDVIAFERIRSRVEHAVQAMRFASGEGLEEALETLSAASSEPWLLFGEDGKLLWLNEEARNLLAIDGIFIGTTFVLSRNAALESLRSWARGQAREADSISRPPPAPPPLARYGRQVASLRYQTKSGRAMVLVGFARPLPGGGKAAAGQAPPDAVERAARFARRFELTPRQTEVLAHLAAGKANRVIAAALGCAENTVELHVTGLLRKLRCESRAELIATFWTT